MPAPGLSVCIPTYNYGRFISRAIESVHAQDDGDLEVMVLDGGSTDSTAAVVEQWSARWPAVRYTRQPVRGGIDADLARAVELSRGTHCWLLSADDALQPSAVARIRAEFGAGRDIVLCERLWCDQDLVPLARHAWLAAAFAGAIDLAEPAAAGRYFEAARSLGALFSFMSCIGFRRASWDEARPPAAVPCYTHVGRLFAMARQGAKLGYLAEPLVLCRGGADSFSGAGLAARLLIDLRGYRTLAGVLFGADERLKRSFLAVVRREHPLRRWIRARSESPAAAWQELTAELRRHGLTRGELWAIELAGLALKGLRGRP